MKRIIVDYKKLTDELVSLFVKKYPDGYTEEDIIRFKNATNETTEAVEVRTDDTIYLVKVRTRSASAMENDDEETFENEEEVTSDDSVEIPDDEDEDEEEE